MTVERSCDASTEYFLNASRLTSHFHSQMDVLLKMRNERRYTILMPMCGDRINNWLAFFRWLVLLHPQYFHVLDTPPKQRLDIFLHQVSDKRSKHAPISIELRF